MEAKHTEGPWFVDESLHVVSTPTGRTVLWMQGQTKEDCANAHLIAAAPKLLGLLEKTVIDIEDFVDPDGIFDFTEEAGRRMVRELQAAIAEAKTSNP